MKHSSLVIAGNGYLARRACSAGAGEIEVIPTVIDLERYPVLEMQPNSAFTIGWIGSPSTAKYLSSIESVLSTICSDQTSQLCVVGVTDVNLHGISIQKKKWSETTEAADIHSFDVGIMPLPDDHWERGKCGYKLIQYMACGKPVIASPVGVNSEIIEHGVNGFLAKNEKEWLEALTALRDDPALRRKMGNAGRKIVEEKFCIQVTASKLLSIFSQVINGEN